MENKTTGATSNSNVKQVTVPIRGHVVPLFSSQASNIVSRYKPTSRKTYNSNDRPIYDIDEIPENFPDQVALCRHYYETDPMTGTIIDIMIQFSAGTVQHVTDNARVKQFFDELYDECNLDQVIKWNLLEYYCVGNSFPYRSAGYEMVKSKNGIMIPKYQWTVLNPYYVRSEGSLLFNQNVITLAPSEELKDLVKKRKNNPAAKRILESFPKEFITAIEQGENIPLDQNLVYHISRNRQPYQRFATPFLMRAITALRIKEKLIQMDLSTADGVINQLVTVTIGSDEHPATQTELDALAELLNTPSKAYALLWNHTLKVEFHRPEADIFDPKKYEQVNADIQAAFGITRSLVDGGDSGYGRTMVSISSLIERLEWGRNDIKKWLEYQYKIIAEEHNLPTYPRVRFSKINLQEDKTVKNILMQLYDRNIISAETLIEETGHEFKVELERIENELKLKKKGFFIPQSPYQQSPNGNRQVGPGRPDGAEDSEPRERDPLPEPHKASAAHNQCNIEDLYKEARVKVKKAVSCSATTKDAQAQAVSILMNLSLKIDSTLRQRISKIFEENYEKIYGGDYSNDGEAVEFLTKLLEEKSLCIHDICFELASRVKDIIGNASKDDMPRLIDAEFAGMHQKLKEISIEGAARVALPEID